MMHSSSQCRRAAWKWLSIFAGAASLAWFLARVIPKPSRASYPCQRAAAPLASGFLIWILGLAGARVLYGKMRRAGFAAAVLALAVYVVWLPLGLPEDATAQEAFVPVEGPNVPIGVGKGIHSGRVVWAHDPGATRWDGQNGKWWDDANTDAQAVDSMVSRSLAALTGEKTGRQAWQALFRNFNQTRKLGANGYRRGQKIAIKINANQDRSAEWGAGRRPLNGMPSPHVVYSLVHQLITAAGVPGGDIVVYDATRGRNIGAPIYGRIRANPSAEFQAVRFLVGTDYELGGRLAPSPDQSRPIRFADPALKTAYLPREVTEAKYLINLALFRPHGLCGVTLCAKNHFGSVYFDDGGWIPASLHNFVGRGRPMGSYNPLVELMGSRNLGGKTLLYMLDGLYSAEHNEGNVMRFRSLGNHWASSLFLSQDQVAIDSVALDFLRAEPAATQVRGNADNYLHEAAQAGQPPSGTVYQPEADGARLESLGVHEHWNNARDRQYSRNLGQKQGIELVSVPKT